jgi:hypothetical protein
MTLSSTIFLESSTPQYFDLTTFLLLTFSLTGLILFKYGLWGFKMWWLDPVTRSAMANWSGRICVKLGYFLFSIGLIQTGFNAPPDYNSLPLAISVSALAIFYAHIIDFLLFAPFQLDKSQYEDLAAFQEAAKRSA